MKGKRYSTEGKVRMLWEAETWKQSIIDICRSKNIPDGMLHRWKISSRLPRTTATRWARHWGVQSDVGDLLSDNGGFVAEKLHQTAFPKLAWWPMLCIGWLVGTYDASHGRRACRINVTFPSRRGSPVGMPQDHLAFMWDNHMKAMP